MTSLPLFQIDAFVTSAPFSGNPAAVVLLERADQLTDEQMLAVAASNNLSETAFFASDDDRPRLRWFTPTTEVDLCGHATLASGWVALQRLRPEAPQVTFETVSGPLTVGRGEGEALLIDLPARPPEAVTAPAGAEDALGVQLEGWLQAAKAMAVLTSADAVLAAQPDLAFIKALPTDGLILTAPGDTGSGVDFVSRYFAPHAGIDEDPVTGSAHCTLVPYWRDRLGRGDAPLEALQVSSRGGALRCRQVENRVLLEGNARLYLEGAIHLAP